MTDLPRGFWVPPLVAVVARLALVLARPAVPETYEYEEIAGNLIAGRGYVLEHFGTPYRGYSSGVLYTLLTAGAYRLGAVGPSLMFLVQALFAAGTTLVVLRIARHLAASPRAALAAALVTALHPALVYYDVYKRHPLGLDAFLIAALVASLLTPPSATSAARSGLVLGAAILERLTLLPMLLIAPLWLAGASGRDRGRRLAMFHAAALLVVAPWLLRNAGVFGAPLLSTMTSEYLFMGNVPPSLGSYHLPSGELTLSAAPAELLERLQRTDERGQARIFQQAFRDFVGAEPRPFAYGVARKLAYFWTWAPQTGVLYPPRFRLIYLLLYGVLLAAALAGALRAAQASAESRRALLLIAALALTVSAQHALLVFEMRHRWSLEPLLVALAATCALPSAARGWRSGGSGRRSDGGDPR